MVSHFGNDATEGANFQKEISNMMHGFGDNPNPNAATVVLVESIVLQQMRSIIQEAFENSTRRGAKCISNYDIIFLMRKNCQKLKRLHDYQKKLEQIDKNDELKGDPLKGLVGDKKPFRKKRRTHIDMIKELDELDEVSLITFDSIDFLRKIRASKITESMSFDKYNNYYIARRASFRVGNAICKGFAKLENWINPTKELKILQSALEILCFLAYETVAEIVDAVFLIRQDSRKKSGDPFSKFEGGYFCNPLCLSTSVYIKAGYEGVPAITVAEVREVLRRYFTPQSGMNGLFHRNMNMDVPVRYIAI